MHSTNQDTVSEEIDYFATASKHLHSRFLLRSPWTLLIATSFYLMFVTKYGPAFMKKRKPMNANRIILVYNLIQCLLNGYMCSQLFGLEGIWKMYTEKACYPGDQSKETLWPQIADVGYLYLVSKFMDLLDTVFFILKKKQSHVTFLHVFHHANMVVGTWLFCKFFSDQQLLVIVALNTFVHTVMYGYYFLAALGPSVKKYLWWKIYVTRLQMVQFAVILIYFIWLWMSNCHISQFTAVCVVVETIIFLLLFTDFYRKSYTKSSDNKK